MYVIVRISVLNFLYLINFQININNDTYIYKEVCLDFRIIMSYNICNALLLNICLFVRPYMLSLQLCLNDIGILLLFCLNLANLGKNRIIRKILILT